MGIRACADRVNCLNTIYKKDSTIDFEMSVTVAEATRGRCASFMILTVVLDLAYRPVCKKVLAKFLT